MFFCISTIDRRTFFSHDRREKKSGEKRRGLFLALVHGDKSLLLTKKKKKIDYEHRCRLKRFDEIKLRIALIINYEINYNFSSRRIEHLYLFTNTDTSCPYEIP